MMGTGWRWALQGIRTLVAAGLAALAAKALMGPLSLLPLLSPLGWALATGAGVGMVGLLGVWTSPLWSPFWERALGLALAGAALAGFLPASFGGAVEALQDLPTPGPGSALLLGLGYAAFLALGRSERLARRWHRQGVERSEIGRGLRTTLVAWGSALALAGLVLVLLEALANLSSGTAPGTRTAWLPPLLGAVTVALLALGLYLGAFRR